MSIRHHYHCDACGEPVEEGAAAQFSGIHAGQTTVASGGVHHWHSCSATCAAKHLRELADKVEERGEQLRREREAYEKDARERAEAQARLAAIAAQG